MATAPRKNALVAQQEELTDKLQQITRSYAGNPDIERFSISINKRAGIAKATAVGIDGKTKTTEMIGPGLTATTTYLPTDKDGRDANIRALRSKGLTQTDIAQQLGISQSLVAKVLKSS